ncbi:hypothetical protein EMCRGX_G019499 [Ephydatia muelleri]
MYEEAVKGALKLKGTADGGVKKKKKKQKDVVEKAADSVKSDETVKIVKTPAEKAFEKVQEKRLKERILKKAAKTHKQRVELYLFQELNRHLDSLSEHYDIPKVSWTK